MIHTSLPRNCVVFLLLCELTRSAVYGRQKFDSHKWPTVLVDEVKGKPCNFETCLCGSLYSTFTTSFYPHAFYNKRLQTLFIDQLDRSKAMCSFKRLAQGHKCHNRDSNPHCAEQKHQSLSSMLLSTQPQHPSIIYLCKYLICFGCLESMGLGLLGLFQYD